MNTVYPLSAACVRWLDKTFCHPALAEPGGTVVRKISAVPRFITQTVLAGVARLKGCEVKLHGSLYLISRPAVAAATLVGSDAVIEAGLLPYLMGKRIIANG